MNIEFRQRIAFTILVSGSALALLACDTYPSLSRDEGESCEESLDCSGALLCVGGTCESISSSSSGSSSSSSSSGGGSSSSSSGGSSSGGSSSGSSSGGPTCATVRESSSCEMSYCVSANATSCYYTVNGSRFTCDCQNIGPCAEQAGSAFARCM